MEEVVHGLGLKVDKSERQSKEQRLIVSHGYKSPAGYMDWYGFVDSTKYLCSGFLLYLKQASSKMVGMGYGTRRDGIMRLATFCS